jgi:hypothetical protein
MSIIVNNKPVYVNYGFILENRYICLYMMIDDGI